ncbi:MAG: hypothetical protein ACRDAM_04105, partial [Casimicrobium sp.]
ALTSGLTAAGGLASVLGAAVPVIGPILAIASALGIGTDKKGFKFDNAATRGGSDGRGGGRSEVIDSALGKFDFAGDFGNSVAQPFIDQIKKLDSLIAKEFLDEKTLAEVQARIQQIADPKWFGANSEGEFKDNLQKATKQFLQERYSTAFEQIDKGIANSIKGFTGNTDELVAYIGNLAELQKIFEQVNETLPGLKIGFGDFVNLSKEDQGNLGTIGGTFKFIGQDFGQIAKDAYELETGGIVNAFIKQGDALDTLVDKFLDGSASVSDLSGGVAEFGQSALQVVNELLRAKDAIDGSVGGGIRSLQLTGLDEEETNRFLSAEAETLRGLIQTVTDPTKITDYVNQIVANSTQVFSALSPEDQERRREEFIGGLQTLQEEAQARIASIEENVLSNTTTAFEDVRRAFAEEIAKFADSAKTNSEAADRNADNVDRFGDATTRFAAALDRNANALETREVGGF